MNTWKGQLIFLISSVNWEEREKEEEEDEAADDVIGKVGIFFFLRSGFEAKKE